MKLGFGCDPNATELKRLLMDYAKELGHEVVDYGSDDPIYARVAFDVAQEVVAKKVDRGVLICGTGIGMSIAANKVKGAACALVNDIYQATRSQLSNNANLIALGAFVLGPETAKALLAEYLANTFDPTSKSCVKVEEISKFESKKE